MAAQVTIFAPIRIVTWLFGPKWFLMFVLPAIVCFPHVSMAQQNLDWPPLFDWCVTPIHAGGTYSPLTLPSGFHAVHEEITPVPLPGAWRAADDPRYQVLYDELFAQNRPLGLRLTPYTSPIHGTKDPGALATVMDMVARLNYVFADFEPTAGTEANEDTLAMVLQVRSHSNPAVNGAFVGNYMYYPGASDKSNPYPSQTDRSDRDAFYRTSGLNVAMPNIYQYSYYVKHTHSTTWGSDVAPNVRAAMFWAPIEKVSVAKRALPDGHQLIPWVGNFVKRDPHVAEPLPRPDIARLLQHVRLRGADGYYMWRSSDENYDNEKFKTDMIEAWTSLDWLFDTDGGVEVLNLETDKTGGVQWSGVSTEKGVVILISNLGNSAVRIPLPDVEGLPDFSPWVVPGEHHIIIVPEPATLSLLALGGLALLRRRRS
ncbi:MAG: PEP-CTERM sorting domain-containing protein [Phycisphaerae bacterium]|nr:PEP-CTERM sorting domain-containing protein [Phycisphaerae bacterium]